MKKKTIIKIVIDSLMLVLMLLEYMKIYTGQLVHEITGIVLFMLFLIHNLLNINFYKNILKGKYNLTRITTTIVDMGFLMCILFTIILGIPISNEVFKGLNLNGNMTMRKLHTILGYWGLIFLSMHLGLHFNMIFLKLKKRIYKNAVLKKFIYLIEVVIIVFGIKFMIDISLWERLIGKLSFGRIDSNIYVAFIKNFVIVVSIGLIVCNIEKILNNNRRIKNG